MYRLTKRAVFDAAHFLPSHPGKCQHLHGHRWEVTAVLETRLLPKDGMVADFGEVKRIITQFDHKNLNEMEAFEAVEPTAENIAQHFANHFLAKWPGRFTHISVTVCESEGSSVEYIPPM